MKPPRNGDGRVGAGVLFAYVAPMVPLAALGLPIVVHLPQFYASREIGLSLGTVGFVFSVLRILDMIIDPAMGYWSDRWRTRLGRRKPLVVLGTPILMLGIWMLFMPGGPVTASYAGLWLFVMYFGWSMVTVPHLSWGAELSPDYHERSRVYGWYQATVVVGMIGVLVIPAVLEHGGSNLAAQVGAMGEFTLLLLPPTILLAVVRVTELEVRLKTHAPILVTLRFLFRNGAFRRVIAIDLLASTSTGAIGAMFLFFTTFALGLHKWSGTLLLVFFTAGCLCTPLWIALSRRIGKHRALLASCIYTFVTMPLLFMIPRGDAMAALLIFPVVGANYGAVAFLLRSMMADIADADAAENHAERAGLMYSFLALTQKWGLGWSVGIAFAVLQAFGFDPKGVNSPAAIQDMRMFYILIPIVLGALSAALLLGYPIDETGQRRLRDEVERRRALPRTDDGEGAGQVVESARSIVQR